MRVAANEDGHAYNASVKITIGRAMIYVLFLWEKYFSLHRNKKYESRKILNNLQYFYNLVACYRVSDV